MAGPADGTSRGRPRRGLASGSGELAVPGMAIDMVDDTTGNPLSSWDNRVENSPGRGEW